MRSRRHVQSSLQSSASRFQLTIGARFTLHSWRATGGWTSGSCATSTPRRTAGRWPPAPWTPCSSASACRCRGQTHRLLKRFMRRPTWRPGPSVLDAATIAVEAGVCVPHAGSMLDTQEPAFVNWAPAELRWRHGWLTRQPRAEQLFARSCSTCSSRSGCSQRSSASCGRVASAS